MKQPEKKTNENFKSQKEKADPIANFYLIIYFKRSLNRSELGKFLIGYFVAESTSGRQKLWQFNF